MPASRIRVRGRKLADEIASSLERQESFDAFEQRMLEKMGVGPMESDTGGAALERIEASLETAARSAWEDGKREAFTARARRKRRGGRLAGVVLLLCLQAMSARAQCAGDCDGDGSVFVSEVVTAVTIALGHRGVFNCAAADRDSSGQVGVDELIACVLRVLHGCSGTPPTLPPAPTRTATLTGPRPTARPATRTPTIEPLARLLGTWTFAHASAAGGTIYNRYQFQQIDTAIDGRRRVVGVDLDDQRAVRVVTDRTTGLEPFVMSDSDPNPQFCDLFIFRQAQADVLRGTHQLVQGVPPMGCSLQIVSPETPMTATRQP